MPSHWTYAEVEPGSDLEQGDFVVPTPALREILSEVHPHFADGKYLGFLILSQTCDLVRRHRKPPSANYVAIAPVRPLRAVLPKLVESVTRPVSARVFRLSAKQAARQLLERIIDQNEQKLGLFYLHQDADLEIGESAVCFLRVSVSLRAQHYPVLIDARRGRLQSEFGNKLGWLAGNLYSRTATPDWADKGGVAATKTLISDYLSPEDDGVMLWVDDSVVEAATQSKKLVPNMPREEALEVLKGFGPQKPLDDAVSAVVRVLTDICKHSGPELDPSLLEKLKNKLRNDGTFRNQLRKPAGSDS